MNLPVPLLYVQVSEPPVPSRPSSCNVGFPQAERTWDFVIPTWIILVPQRAEVTIAAKLGAAMKRISTIPTVVKKTADNLLFMVQSPLLVSCVQ
jgi:hypothetical protein